jgi:hypothetical protein
VIVANQKRKIDVFSLGSNDFRSDQKSEMTAGALTNALAQANRFDLSYLVENARGELAQGQLGLLTSPMLISLILILVPGGFLGFQLYQQGYIKQITSGGIPLIEVLSNIPQGLLIFGGVLMLLSLFGLYNLVQTVLDLVGGAVVSLEGPGWRKITTSRDDDGSTTTTTYYVVADQRFRVKKNAIGVIENGRNYRVYFTPRKKILVNMEALD